MHSSSDKRAKGRIPGIEFYRTLLMFGICMLHSVSQGGNGVGSKIATSILLACVCGFVFISGYFGIRFKLSKLVKLYGLGLFAAVVNTCFFYHCDPVTCGGFIRRLVYTFKDYWFLNAYAVLMLMSPLLNLALREIHQKEGFYAVVFTMICVIGWSFVAQLPLLRSWLPASAGLQNYSGFLFMGIYLLAGTWRVLDFDGKVMRSWGLAVLISITAIYPLCLGAYSSPFSIMVAGVCFSKCKRLALPVWLDRICSFVGPSLFSIYLIHTNHFGFDTIKAMKSFLTDVGCPYSLSCMGVACLVFITCLAIDMIRRLLLSPLRGMVNGALDRLDLLVDESIEKFLSAIG